ncbi:Hypothetical protein, putative [Bodo saltans]|uniref:Uncharacterized protein n=1 Tax=Bodo saltans TaxID=75058 RepID=A0A0S4J994_BODSA|nr:Hypothetical protein, putative [Bodo saltans]|eukprot:CUG86928.1 Hypothetical protein, putative [Bodo saltans]
MPSTQQENSTKAVGRTTTTAQRNPRESHFGFGLCTLLLAVSAAATEATATHANATAGASSSGFGSSSSSSGAPSFAYDRYLPDYMEDMFYDAFCYHEFFTSRTDCPANLEDLQSASKRLFAARTRKSSHGGKKSRKLDDDDEEDEEDDRLEVSSIGELLDAAQLHDITTSEEGASSVSPASIAMSSSSSQDDTSLVIMPPFSTSPSTSSAADIVSLILRDDFEDTAVATSLVPEWIANIRRVRDATRELLLRASALPSTADECVAEMFMRAIVCVPYNAATMGQSMNPNARSASSALIAQKSASSIASSSSAQQRGAVAPQLPAEETTTKSIVVEEKDSSATPNAATENDGVVHRLFFGQLRKEVSTEFVTFLLQNIMAVDVAKYIVKVEMHTSSSTAHARYQRNNNQNNSRPTAAASQSGATPAGRAKGCAWVDVRGTAVRDHILSFHKRLYLGDDTMMMEAAAASQQHHNDDSNTESHNNEYLLVVDDAHKEWLAAAASTWTNEEHWNRDALSKGSIVIEIPKQKSTDATTTAPTARNNKCQCQQQQQHHQYHDGISAYQRACGMHHAAAEFDSTTSHHYVSSHSDSSPATVVPSMSRAYFSKVTPQTTYDRVAASVTSSSSSAPYRSAAASSFDAGVQERFGGEADDASNQNVVAWRHHPYDWMYSRQQVKSSY